MHQPKNGCEEPGTPRRARTARMVFSSSSDQGRTHPGARLHVVAVGHDAPLHGAVCVAQVDTLVKHREARAVGTRSRGDDVGGIGRVGGVLRCTSSRLRMPYRSGDRVSRDRRAPTRRRPTLAASALRWRNACVREECPAPVPAPAAARRSARDCRTRHRRFTARQVCSPAAPCGWPAAVHRTRSSRSSKVKVRLALVSATFSAVRRRLRYATGRARRCAVGQKE